MHSEPIAYAVGDAEVRIITAVDEGALPSNGRVYVFTVRRNGVETWYRSDVHLRDILQKSDQQLAEYLIREARNRTRLTP